MEEKRHACHARFPLDLRLIHLITAALVTFIFVLTSVIFVEGINHTTMLVVHAHQPIGILVLLFTLWRIVLRMKSHMCGLQGNAKYAAYTVEGLLYFCLLGMPITGFFMCSFGGYPIHAVFGLIPPFTAKNPELASLFKLIHNYMAGCFLALIGMHIAAALYHAVVLKDKVLRRIGFGDIEEALHRYLDEESEKH